MNHAMLMLAGAAGAAASIAGAAFPARIRVRIAAFLTWCACTGGALVAIDVLRSGRPATLHSNLLLPITGLDLSLDPLGAIFVLLISMVAVAATIYWLGYAEHGLSSRVATGVLPLFVTSMLFVPMAGSVATFLFVWELMALSSLLLLLVSHARGEAPRSAAQWYGVMTHAGASAILFALVLLAAHAGGQTFVDIRAHSGHLTPAVRDLAFVLALIGFGSKAGAVPLHVWLPKAHPEAPSPVSALMSAGMVSLGVYGIIRVGDGLLGGGPAWWWLTVIAVGIASALFGALHAATSVDLKRLLASSTTDNMGLVLIGVGASGLFASTGHPPLATLAMVSALLLVFNHAAFKGSLFLSAGSVQVATGTRDLDHLGGLLKRLPVTGALFVVGALAIAALPPLNGFVGEWLLFQSLLHGLSTSNTSVDIVMPIAVAALALTSGLTAAAFVKAIGVGFLGQPRSDDAAAAVEVAPSMQLGAGMLAVICVVIGVAPTVVMAAIERASAAVISHGGARAVSVGINFRLTGIQGVLAPDLIAVGLVIAVVVVVVLRRLLERRPGYRRAEAWGCGRELQTAKMQYTATSFAEPLQRVFDDVLRPDHDLDVSHVAESRYFVESVAYRTSIDDAIERGAYRPIIRGVGWWGQRARHLQNGSVHRYLAYGLVALVVILAVIT